MSVTEKHSSRVAGAGGAAGLFFLSSAPKGSLPGQRFFLRKASWLVVGLVVWLVGGLPPCGGGCGRGKGGRAVGWRR